MVIPLFWLDGQLDPMYLHYGAITDEIWPRDGHGDLANKPVHNLDGNTMSVQGIVQGLKSSKDMQFGVY